MAWQDDLYPASWRGLPFEVEATSSTHGRRLARHEYPDRDEGFVEDLGRRLRPFRVTGFIVSDDVAIWRERFIAAAEQEGTGTLVHPYLGELEVRCESLDVDDTKREGRTTRLTFTFVEAGARRFPQVTVDTVLTVQGDARTLETTAAAVFAASFSTDGYAGFVGDQAVAALGDALQQITDALAPFASAVDDISGALEAATDITARLTALVADPEALALELLDLFGLLGVYRLYLQLADLFPDPTTRTTTSASAAQAQTNASAINRLLRRAALAGACDAAAAADWSVYDEAVAARDDLTGRLADEEAKDDLDDNAYDAIVELRTAVTEDITARAADLGRLTTYTPPAITSSLELAHRFYDDVEREAEITDRNAVIHPGFIAPAPLQVLSS